MSADGPEIVTLHDPHRLPHPTPCPDCHREHLQGEHVALHVPTNPTGTRVAWQGCIDCWLRRTNVVPLATRV